MTQNSTVTWVRQDTSWSQTSAVELRTTDTSLPDAPYVQRTGSGLSITYLSDNPSVVDIYPLSNDLILRGQAGRAVITASVAANGDWSAASASYTLIVYDPAAQIKLSNTTLLLKIGQTLGLAASMVLNNVDTGFPLSAQDTANNYFGYAVGKAGDTGSASINSRSGILTGLTPGSVTVIVTLYSTRQYAAMSAEFVVTIAKGDSVLSWVSIPATSIKMGETPSVLTASHTGSTTAVAYTSSNRTVASINNPATGVITLVGPGSTTISAILAADNNYNAAPTLAYTLTVAKGDSVLTWVGTPLTSIRMDETPPTIAALPSGSTAAVSYSSDTPTVARIDNPATGVITLVGPGSTRISATLVADNNYNDAPPIAYILTVNKLLSTLSWTSTPTMSFKVGEAASFTFVASHTGSTAEVTYHSSDLDVMTIDSATGDITLVGAGSTTISAVLPEDANYQGLTITYDVTVAKGDSVLSWVSTSAASIKMSETPSVPQVAQSYSDSTTATVYRSTNQSVARIDPTTGVITLVGIGGTTIIAALPDDANYQATPISYAFTVEIGDSTLSWASTPAASVTMGDVLPAFAVSRSGSTTALVYSSSNPSVAKISSSGAVTLCGLGTTTITAELRADRNYYAAPQPVTYDMTVSRGDAAVSLLYSPFSVYVNEKLTLIPVAKRVDTGTVVVEDLTYYYAVGAAGDTGTATIDAASGVLTGVTSGSVTVTVTCTSNLYQVTGTQSTVTVLASSCVVTLPVTTKTLDLGDGQDPRYSTTINLGGDNNDPSYQIVPTTVVNGVVAHNGAPYQSSTYDFSYRYALSDVSPAGSVTLSPGGLITGSSFGTATVTITVTFTTPELDSTSLTLLVSVLDGDPNTPRPTGQNVDYPAYTGSEPPQLEAVQALLDDLMPVAQGQTHDDPNSTAAQLFGLDLSYFANVQPDGKKMVFSINEANDIYQMSCAATSHLRLKTSKELVLGDNISFTVTRGNTFNLNVNLNNKDDLEGQDSNNDGVDDSTRTGHGVVNTSITGIAAELELGAYQTYDDSLYPSQEAPDTTDTNVNFVYLPKLNKVKLDYGRITSSRRDRVVKLEFIGPGKANKNSAGRSDGDANNGNLNTLESTKRHPYSLKPEECAYAEFTQITKDGFKPYKGASKGITAKGRGNPSILPEEDHLGLLGDYFHDETNGGKAMGEYDTIDLPDYVLNDDFLDTTQVDGGVNFLQFRKGKGRMRHEYMDNTIKMLQKAKAVFNVNIAGGIRDFFVSAAVSELDFSGTMICHSWVSPVGFNQTVCIVSTNLSCFGVRANAAYRASNCEDHVTAYLSSEWHWGVRVSNGVSFGEENQAATKLDQILNEEGVVRLAARGIYFDNREIQQLVGVVKTGYGSIWIKERLNACVETAARKAYMP